MSSGFSQLIDDIQRFLPHIPEILFSLLIGVLFLSVALLIIDHSLAVARFPKALRAIIRSLASLILWVILIAHLFHMAGLTQVALTVSGSLLVIGLAIANGANTLVADVISGLFLAKDPDFDIGYEIKSGETEGVIESIDIRKTRVRLKDKSLVVLPNSLLDKERWHVTLRPTKRSRATTQMEEIQPES